MVHHSSFLSSRTSSASPSGSPFPCATYSPSRWPVLPPSQPSAPTRSSILHNKRAPRLYTTHRPSITQHFRGNTRLKCQPSCSHRKSSLPYSTSLRSSSPEGQSSGAAPHLDQQSSRSTVVLDDLGQAQLLKLSSTALTTPLHLQPFIREKALGRSHGHTGHVTAGGVCAPSKGAENDVDTAAAGTRVAATRHARIFNLVQQTQRPLQPTTSSFRCLTKDDAPAAITIDTARRTRQGDGKDGRTESSALLQDQPAHAQGASPPATPLTPIPTDPRFTLDPSPSIIAAPSSHTDPADSLRSQAECHGNNSSNNSSSVNALYSVSQTWTGDSHTAQDVKCASIAVPTTGNEHALDAQRRNKLGGRDSGIALESWDLPDHHPGFPTGIHMEMEGAVANLAIDQRLQREAHGLGLDGQQEQSAGRVDRRKRCQSMVYASGRRTSQDSLLFSDDELVFQMDTSTCTSTAASSHEPRNRGRQRVSISSGCDRGALPRSPSLPPLPPTAGSNSVPRTSFFCSPPNNDTSEDTDKDHSQRQSLHNTNSYFSSSMPDSAAILLAKPPLPSSLPESTLAHGVPFSTMMDLATAKAENITGLYFARQMNLKASPHYSSTDLAATTPAIHESDLDVLLNAVNVNSSSSEQSRDCVFEDAKNTIKIKVSAPSPIARRERVLTASGDSLHSASNYARLGCPQPATANPNLPPLPGTGSRDVSTSKRCRAVTNSDTLVSTFHPCDNPSMAVDTSVRTESAHAPGCPPAPPSPSAPTRGHHRRSQSASHFFHLSSLKHHSPAQFNLALCYEHGQGGVERDLAMALHFYQQAADQGHTKASYNIGCICYNLGEVSKAMAWFESAGKCSVRGLKTEEVEKSSSCSSHQAPPFIQCPTPKHTSLPHELEDMLLGDMAATSGPFAAYLPAILCLALLCRQGVRSREGAVILERDQEQAVELLKRLLQRTSARSHLGARGGNSQDTENNMAGSGSSTTRGDLRKRSSLDFQRGPSALANPTIVPASLSTSCPSLPSGQWGMSPGTTEGSAIFDPLVESLAVEDALDGERNRGHDLASGSGTDAGCVKPTFFSAEPLGPDVHEAWSATLAQQLLKAWTRQSAEWPWTVTATSEFSLDQKILRHHLLYITNPTLGKNLYNLGVLYDIYLGEHLIAARCYESAYRNIRLAADISCGLYSTLVTRINSAWNLGVIYAKQQNWCQAKCWFLKAQQDVLLHTQRQSEQDLKGCGKDQVRRDRTKAHASLVNVVPGNIPYLPNDSPEKTRVREHGLMMSFPSSTLPSRANRSARVSKHKRTLRKQRHCQGQEGFETDVTKVAWVLRWIDSNIQSST